MSAIFTPLDSSEYALLPDASTPPPIPPKSSARTLRPAKKGSNNTQSCPSRTNAKQYTYKTANVSGEDLAQKEWSTQPRRSTECPNTISYFSDDSSSDGSRDSTVTSHGSIVTQIWSQNSACVSTEGVPDPDPPRPLPLSTIDRGDMIFCGDQQSMVQRSEFAQSNRPLPLALRWNNVLNTKWEPARESELWTPKTNAFSIASKSSIAYGLQLQMQQESKVFSDKNLRLPIPTISLPVDTQNHDEMAYMPSLSKSNPSSCTSRSTPRLQVPCHRRGSSEPFTRVQVQEFSLDVAEPSMAAKNRWIPTLPATEAVTPSSTSSLSSVPYENDDDGACISASPLDISPVTPQMVVRETSKVEIRSPHCDFFSPQSRFSIDSDLEENTKPTSPQASPFGLIQHGYSYDSVVPSSTPEKFFDESAVGENTLKWLAKQKKPSYHVRNDSSSDRNRILGTYFRRSTIS
ncbi:uncharacterized protein PV09_04364 [Verruconis gallopava]|uniref:Uncharacterized protein n=1 Tax=Verruconis gallopava TaxID=253628 RepID=A0A0D1YVB7_9PEZI|nr:uncharacterized protein PV09_04364 [Verruconis gallopava]KIW04617.1 hypothetical protein PV09_04364 [Verruconis gallopava]